jgi:hypothetical protein
MTAIRCLTGFADTDILPFGGRVLAIRSDGPLRPVLTYIPSFPIYPLGIQLDPRVSRVTSLRFWPVNGRKAAV